MSAELQLKRNEESRWAVLAFLAARPGTAHDADRIKQRLSTSGEDWTQTEVKAACEFLLSQEWVTEHKSPVGSTRYFRITAEGTLAWERQQAV